MRLLRFGPAGMERPGLIDDNGLIRDLSAHVHDIDLAVHTDLIATVRKIDPETLPIVDGTERLGPPVANVGKFVAIGLNFADHAAEAGQPIPAEPILCMKATSCLAGPNDDIILPCGSMKTDWEVELGIVIGKRASYVDEAEAPDHVAGFLTVNDVTEREYQLERGGTWDKGKGCDTFGPIGPWLVTKDEITDVQALAMWLDVNGEPMQRGNTITMIFDCAKIVAYVSRFMTLHPGDIITTGTPPGVGLGMTPPRFLKAGDEVTLGIDGLGSQRQRVRSIGI